MSIRTRLDINYWIEIIERDTKLKILLKNIFIFSSKNIFNVKDFVVVLFLFFFDPSRMWNVICNAFQKLWFIFQGKLFYYFDHVKGKLNSCYSESSITITYWCFD